MYADGAPWTTNIPTHAVFGVPTAKDMPGFYGGDEWDSIVYLWMRLRDTDITGEWTVVEERPK